MRKKLVAIALGALSLGATAAPAAATDMPNQGNTDNGKLVYLVNNSLYESCAGHVVPLDKVEGDFGTSVYVSAEKPIAKITVKSGVNAQNAGSYFNGTSAKIKLTKDVSNYVIWVCDK